MNRESLEQKILLAESGELDARARLALDACLAAQPETAAQLEDLRRLLAAARAALPAPAPSAAVRPRILEIAAARVAPHAPAHRFAPVWLRGLAYAAVVALAIGLGLFHGAPGATPDRIAQMHAIVALTRTESDQAKVLTKMGETSANARLHALAQDLLRAEGLALDETAVEEAGDEEATPDAAPAPTALQPHSSHGLSAKTYG